jgi:hypothetical protein
MLAAVEPMSIVSYALLCVVTPQLWAVLVAHVYRVRERQRARREAVQAQSPDYRI